MQYETLESITSSAAYSSTYPTPKCSPSFSTNHVEYRSNSMEYREGGVAVGAIIGLIIGGLVFGGVGAIVGLVGGAAIGAAYDPKEVETKKIEKSYLTGRIEQVAQEEDKEAETLEGRVFCDGRYMIIYKANGECKKIKLSEDYAIDEEENKETKTIEAILCDKNTMTIIYKNGESEIIELSGDYSVKEQQGSKEARDDYNEDENPKNYDGKRAENPNGKQEYTDDPISDKSDCKGKEIDEDTGNSDNEPLPNNAEPVEAQDSGESE